MIFPDPKKSATMILSKLSANGGPDKMQDVKKEVELDPAMDGLKSAAEDIMQAFSDKSPHDLMQALKSFVAMVDSSEASE